MRVASSALKAWKALLKLVLCMLAVRVLRELRPCARAEEGGAADLTLRRGAGGRAGAGDHHRGRAHSTAQRCSHCGSQGTHHNVLGSSVGLQLGACTAQVGVFMSTRCPQHMRSRARRGRRTRALQLCLLLHVPGARGGRLLAVASTHGETACVTGQMAKLAHSQPAGCRLAAAPSPPPRLGGLAQGGGFLVDHASVPPAPTPGTLLGGHRPPLAPSPSGWLGALAPPWQAAAAAAAAISLSPRLPQSPRDRRRGDHSHALQPWAPSAPHQAPTWSASGW